ncbi:hypothetical protein [Nocardioides mangrovi]|uniref:Uncharacterized protein n=1 Tax=Nocardioides mangrovi TaxID=2874580 RepID=A0ABS7U7M6_9ACTN|nr:hypothetical protein [Nocardioides mangrovi]MBZ5736889.1 hypothetical protein [Nocardioides mangrovi]
MTFLILLLVVAAALAAATVHLIRHDGLGPQRRPASHFEDTRFLSPLAR